MHKIVVAGLMGAMMAVAAGNVAAQVAGSTTIGVPATEITTLTKGWSAKRQILGKPVHNDQDEKVGQVEDIIVAPDKSISYAILSAVRVTPGSCPACPAGSADSVPHSAPTAAPLAPQSCGPSPAH